MTDEVFKTDPSSSVMIASTFSNEMGLSVTCGAKSIISD